MPVSANNSADSVGALRTCTEHSENTQGAGDWGLPGTLQETQYSNENESSLPLV